MPIELKEGPLLAVRLADQTKKPARGPGSGLKWVVLQCDCISALGRRVTVKPITRKIKPSLVMFQNFEAH